MNTTVYRKPPLDSKRHWLILEINFKVSIHTYVIYYQPGYYVIKNKNLKLTLK